MLYVRMNAAFSIDTPPASAAQTYPLTGKGSQQGIFDIVRPELKMSGDGYDVPTLVFRGMKVFGSNAEGKALPVGGQRVSSLWTFTSKMGAPSFSLPAGPTTEAGTCSAANYGRSGGKRTPGKQYICDACYSLEGRYVMYNIAIGQGARMWWVNHMIQQDTSGGKLGQALTAALGDYARFGSMSGLRGGLENRIIIELGVWDGTQIVVPMKHPVSGALSPIPAVVTNLPKRTGFGDTRQFFAARKPSAGEVVGFFRIHDSGDLNIGRGTTAWQAYLNAWVITARAYPNVIFWMPTRAWIFPRVKRMLQAACAAAPNLIVRPSALNVGDPSPNIPGLPAGSTVAAALSKREFTVPPSGGRSPTYLCPVNTDWNYDPTVPPAGRRKKPGAWVTKQSCQLADCRACWIAPQTETGYGEHV